MYLLTVFFDFEDLTVRMFFEVLQVILLLRVFDKVNNKDDHSFSGGISVYRTYLSQLRQDARELDS